MVRATVDPGVCRFIATIEVSKIDRQKVAVEITSNCQNIARFRELIREINGYDPITPEETLRFTQLLLNLNYTRHALFPQPS